MPFERDLLGINERIRLEEIYQRARTPGPRAERAPVVDFTRLTFVDETDDALPQLVVIAAIGLDAARIEIAVAPAERDGRLLPCRSAIWERRVVSRRWRRTACGTCTARGIARGCSPTGAGATPASTPLNNHGHSSGCIRGRRDRRRNVDFDRWVICGIDVTDKRASDGRNVAAHTLRRRRDLPRDLDVFRRCWQTAEELAIEN